MARPKQRLSYEPDSDLADLAASYGFGLIKNHPFIDGNKRIGLVTANMFLLLNGHEIEAPEPQIVDITIRVADGSLTETEFAAWIRAVLVPLDS
jgi:death on curing protein